MKRELENNTVVITMPIFHDWTIEDVYLAERDEDGKFKRQPDGEPSGWQNVLEYKGKAYSQLEECECNIDKKICSHWRLIRRAK